jgi:hypothetical protein
VPLTHKRGDSRARCPQFESNKKASASSGLIDVRPKIGHERQHLMESLRGELLRLDDAEALERARELTGILQEKTSTSMLR